MSKPLIIIAFLINILGAVFLTTLWIKNIKKQLGIPSADNLQYDWIISQFKAFNRDIFPLHSIQSILAHLSILLFTQFLAKSLFQFIAQYTSFKFTKLIKCLSNIVESGLLFTMILGFIVVPMLIENHQLQQQNHLIEGATPKEEKYGKQLIRLLLQSFFYGRILFSVGYLFGIVTGLQSFRAYGVGLTLASILVALSYTYDLQIWNYF